MLASLDWSPIIAAAIITIPALWAAVVSTLNRREIKTPSGDTLGRVSERTHDLSAANNMMLNKINGSLNGEAAPEGETVPHD